MDEHGRGGRLRVTGQDRADDRLVLCIRVPDIALQQRNSVQQRVDPHAILGHQRHQRRRSGRLGDRQMQPRIQPAIVIGTCGAQFGQPGP